MILFSSISVGDHIEDHDGNRFEVTTVHPRNEIITIRRVGTEWEEMVCSEYLTNYNMVRPFGRRYWVAVDPNEKINIFPRKPIRNSKGYWICPAQSSEEPEFWGHEISYPVYLMLSGRPKASPDNEPIEVL